MAGPICKENHVDVFLATSATFIYSLPIRVFIWARNNALQSHRQLLHL